MPLLQLEQLTSSRYLNCKFKLILISSIHAICFTAPHTHQQRSHNMFYCTCLDLKKHSLRRLYKTRILAKTVINWSFCSPSLRMFNVNIVLYNALQLCFWNWMTSLFLISMLWLCWFDVITLYCFILQSITFKWSYPIQAYLFMLLLKCFCWRFQTEKVCESTIVKSYLTAEKNYWKHAILVYDHLSHMQQNLWCHSLTETNETLQNNYGQIFLWIENSANQKNKQQQLF